MRKQLFILSILFFFSLSLKGQSPDINDAKKLITRAKDSITNERFEVGIQLSEAALGIYTALNGPNSIGVGDAKACMASALIKTDQFTAGLSNLDQAKAIFEENLPEAKPNLISLYNNYGSYYQAINDIPLAYKFYQKAVDESLKEPEFPKEKLGKFYYNLGYISIHINELEKAQTYLERAKASFEESVGEEHVYMSNCLAVLGYVCRINGKQLKTYEYYTKSLEINLKVVGEDSPSTAYSYSNLGMWHQENGDYDKALDLFTKALNIRRKVLPEGHSEIGIAYTNVGTAYNFKGETAAAIQNYEKGIDIWIRKQGLEVPLTASMYNNLGMAYYYNKDWKKALEYHEKALAIFTKTVGPTYQEVPNVQANIANDLSHLGRFEEAQAYFEKAISTLDTIRNRAGLGSIYRNMAQLYQQKGDLNQANLYIQNALANLDYNVDEQTTIFSEINSKVEALYSLIQYGEIQLDLYLTTENDNSLDLAQECFDQATRYVDYFRTILTTKDSRRVFNENIQNVFEGLLQVLFIRYQETGDEQYLAQLFNAMEKSSNYNLHASIQNIEALEFSNIPKAITTKDAQLKREIAAIERSIYIEKGKNSENLRTLEDNRFELKTSRETFLKELEAKYPTYHQLKYNTNTVDLETLQRDYLQDNQALIEYFVGQRYLYILVVSKNKIRAKQLKLDFPLEQWVQELHQHLKKPEQQGAYSKIAFQLYEHLMLPIEKGLPDVINIVPNGILHYIPFEALLTEEVSAINKFANYPYLIRQHQISYNYSATLWKEMQDKQHQKSTKSWLGVAPEFKTTPTLPSAPSERYLLGPLEHNQPEIIAIQNLTKGEMLLGVAATKAQFLEQADQFAILHLATHGKANDASGDFSFLAFSYTDSSRQNLLFTNELYNLELNADLVVLSACETGIGELQKGEGMLSQSRGFSYAGTKSLLSTLWNVDDRKAKEIMIAFYENTNRGMSKPLALQRAKLSYLESTSHDKAHPYYWAGHILSGDPSPIQRSNRSWMILIGLFILAVGIFGYSRSRFA